MKKFFIALIGGTVLLLGVVLLILPGPGILVIVVGLAILATEFLWARRVSRQTKEMVTRMRRKSRLRSWLHGKKASSKDDPQGPETGGGKPAN